MSEPLDLVELAAEMELMSFDKSDLFDFYHGSWADLVAEIEQLRANHESLRQVTSLFDHKLGDRAEQVLALEADNAQLRAALTEALNAWEAQATMDDIDGRIAELRRLTAVQT